MNKVEEAIRKIISQSLELEDINVDEIGAEEELINYGVTSIVFIKIVLKIESEFDIEYEDDEIDSFKFANIRSYVEFIECKI